MSVYLPEARLGLVRRAIRDLDPPVAPVAPRTALHAAAPYRPASRRFASAATPSTPNARSTGAAAGADHPASSLRSLSAFLTANAFQSLLK